MNKKVFFWIVFFCAICVIPVSTTSFWTDEATTAYLASQDTFFELIDKLLTLSYSEALMPGYILYSWVWEKGFGHSELSLRLANLPPFLSLLFSIYFLPRKESFRFSIIALFTLNPFVWYNMNEARSTISIFSFAGLSLVGLLFYFSEKSELKKAGIHLTIVSLLLGVFFNVLFFFYLLPLSIIFICLTIQNKVNYKSLLQDWAKGLAILFLLCCIVLSYYVYTLLRGAGGMIEPPNLANIGFVLYEFLGLSGLGPPRETLRAVPTLNTMLPYLWFIVPVIISYILFFLIATKNEELKASVNNPYLISFVVGVASFYAIAGLFSFRFWGRHLIFLLPIFLFYIGERFYHVYMNYDKKTVCLISILPIMFWCFSNYNIRFNEKYQKENNKLAAHKAIEFSKIYGKENTVMWLGNFILAAYYGLGTRGIIFPGEKITGPKTVVIHEKSSYEELNNFSKGNINAILVLFDRFNNYDKNKNVKRYLDNNMNQLLYQGQHFKIYRVSASG